MHVPHSLSACQQMAFGSRIFPTRYNCERWIQLIDCYSAGESWSERAAEPLTFQVEWTHGRPGQFKENETFPHCNELVAPGLQSSDVVQTNRWIEMSEKQINFEWQHRPVHLHLRDADAFHVKFDRKSAQRSIWTKLMYKGESSVLDLTELSKILQV